MLWSIKYSYNTYKKYQSHDLYFLKVLFTWLILFPSGHFRKSINYAINTSQKVLIMQLILFKSIIRVIHTFFKRKSIKRVITTFTKGLTDRIKLFRVAFCTFWFRVKIRRKITEKIFFSIFWIFCLNNFLFFKKNLQLKILFVYHAETILST